MPVLEFTVHHLRKRVPLTISRGTRTHGEIVHVIWREDDLEGWGEAVAYSIGEHSETVAQINEALESLQWIRAATAWDRHAVETRLRAEGFPNAVVAALNQAMYDWMGRKLGQPVHRLLGLPSAPGPATSVTIGISEPERAAHRVRQWLELHPFEAFKVKLGSASGVAADQAMMEAVMHAAPAGSRLSVDANGGWSIDDALVMARWLADRGVDHLEQPLRRGDESNLARLRELGALPVIVDESCCTALDVPRLASLVSGINIKLMKCGGLDGALRLVQVARAHGLKILVGCYGNSALGNTCAATIGALVDYIDLDSHLNLEADPFRGADLRDGRLHLSNQSGFGIFHV